MTKDNLNLDARLTAACELVPDGAILLDVGTDHGYLPAKLILDGKIPSAGASDVNDDPLSKAIATAERYGVSADLSFYLSDGLNGIGDLERYTAISICGMGGELIARIIGECDLVKTARIPLILQPMSSVEDLSEYLCKAGFAIEDERIATAAGKIYRILRVRYDGTVRDLSPVEHILGRINIDRGASVPEFTELLLKTVGKFRQICKGKTAGGLDCTAESDILRELYRIADKEGIPHDDT